MVRRDTAGARVARAAVWLDDASRLLDQPAERIDAMAALVAPLTDDQIGAIAKHFASLPARPSGEPIDAAQKPRGAQLAARLRCVSCHRADFAGQDQAPAPPPEALHQKL